jgi:hypothetical protein
MKRTPNGVEKTEFRFRAVEREVVIEERAMRGGWNEKALFILYTIKEKGGGGGKIKMTSSSFPKKTLQISFLDGTQISTTL